jgi:hypothetical protein
MLGLLPTPTVNDAKNSTLPPSQIERNGIAGWILETHDVPVGGKLNPNFVEFLMGFPQDWTKVEPND